MLGDGTTNDKLVLTQIGTATNWKFASSCQWHSVGLKVDDSLSLWGDNLGVTPTSYSLYPIGVSCTNLLIEEQESQSFSIYPNPTNSVLNVTFSNREAIQMISIIDMTGKIVLQQIGDITQINVQNLAKGIYVVSLVTNDKVINQKFIKG